jgi:hypothetical protein
MCVIDSFFVILFFCQVEVELDAHMFFTSGLFDFELFFCFSLDPFLLHVYSLKFLFCYMWIAHIYVSNCTYVLSEQLDWQRGQEGTKFRNLWTELDARRWQNWTKKQPIGI